MTGSKRCSPCPQVKQDLSSPSKTVFIRSMVITCLNFLLETLKHWAGVHGASLTSWGEGTSLALVGHPFSDTCFSLTFQPITSGFL